MCDATAKLAIMAVVCAAGCGRMGYTELEATQASGIVMDATPQAALLTLSTETTWQHTVGDNGNRILLVTTNTNWWNYHPVEVFDDGVAMEQVRAQDAMTWGALSLWRAINPRPGQHTLTVRYSLPVSSILRSVSFSGVDSAEPLSDVRSGTHAGVGTDAIASRPGDLCIAVVSWASTQVTDWLADEIELWDDNVDQMAFHLAGAAATQPGGPEIDFTWKPTGASSLSGAHMLFSLRAAD